MSNYDTYGGWMGGEAGGSGPGSMSRGEARDGSAGAGSGSHQAQWSSSGNPNQRRNEQLGPAGHGPQNSSFNQDRHIPVQQQGQPDSFDNKAMAQGDDVPNDCEILCIGQPDYAYVTTIEGAIKDIGLRADIMIPNPNVKLSNFIENLATKGTIFAVVIRPDNVAQRNISVYVLQGQPKEHPNMSLATACNLIHKVYFELKKKEIGELPENIKNILRYVLQDKPLTDQEYGVVIAFFQERRKRQASFENRTPRGHNEKVYYCPKELQQRILTLIGGQEPTSRRTMGQNQNSMDTMARANSSGYGNSGQNQG